MKALQRTILEQLIAGSAEPIIVARVDRPDWPVVLCNEAFDAIGGEQAATNRPFADVVEQMIGRELALEVSESVRSGQETSIPIEISNREYLLDNVCEGSICSCLLASDEWQAAAKRFNEWGDRPQLELNP